MSKYKYVKEPSGSDLIIDDNGNLVAYVTTFNEKELEQLIEYANLWQSFRNNCMY